jgi:tRNA G18 (ribose-2'-O)-methylase SpoU
LLPDGVELLQDRGFRIVAITPSGDVELRDTKLRGRIAVLVGSEGPGLTAESLAAADVRVRIGMASGVDSLNVATAAAIAFAAIAD